MTLAMPSGGGAPDFCAPVIGWRASHAFPERLCVVPGAAQPATVEAAVRGLSRYGVPVGVFEATSFTVSELERQFRAAPSSA